MVAVIAILLLGFGAILFVMTQKIKELKEESTTQLLKQDIVTLNEAVQKVNDGLKDHMTARLDKTQEAMARQYEASAKIIRDVTQKLTELDRTNRQVGDIATELKTLQNVLQNPKQRGVVGEYYLRTVLENVMPPGRFAMQHRFKDGEIVDAVIFLDKNKILPIDSKFSLENYNRIIEEKDKAAKEVIVKKFKVDLKNRIDETSKYIRPRENTMDFAFMFIPSESLYYDLLINKVGTTATNSRDLIEYAFAEKHVIIVSPTSFMAYLQTVLQGLRSLQIEEQAIDIQKRVGELGRHIQVYETYMQKLGSSLGTTVNHYNSAHKELKKIDKDIVKIADKTAGVEPILLDKPAQDDL